jgi:hypothetical protein
MTGLLIILAVLVVPYVAFNIRRVRRGRAWAFTVCQVAKEWEQREHEKRLATRAAATQARSREVDRKRVSGNGLPS